MMLRGMTAADLDEVLEIERRSFPEPWTRGMFLHELKVPFSTTVLMRADDPPHELVGYVCHWLVGDEMQILNVAVRPERRQHGLGRALVQLVLDEARRAGVRVVTLEVQRSNAAAIALYRALGFVETGTRRNYYGSGEDALLMSRGVAAEPRTVAEP